MKMWLEIIGRAFEPLMVGRSVQTLYEARAELAERREVLR